VAKTSTIAPTANLSRERLKIIDCDVHGLPVSPRALIPYLDDPRKSWVTHWRGPSRIPYVHPLGGSTATNLAPAPGRR
jgi:hypothetical protein